MDKFRNFLVDISTSNNPLAEAILEAYDTINPHELTGDYVLSKVMPMVKEWASQLKPYGIDVGMGGSLVSNTFTSSNVDTIDMDVRFLTDIPETPEEQEKLIKIVENITGLKYRKTIIVDDYPEGKSTSFMIEGMIKVSWSDLPLEVEGSIRSKKWGALHQQYRNVFSDEELAHFRKEKERIRSHNPTDKTAYKQLKKGYIDTCQRRIVEKGIDPSYKCVDEVETIE